MEIIKRMKVKLIKWLRTDEYILQHVQSKELIDMDEYKTLKTISDPGKQITKLLDLFLTKNERACMDFLDLLKDDEVNKNIPELKEWITVINTANRSQNYNQGTADYREFLRKNRGELISRVKGVDRIVDDLYFINEMVANVRAQKTDEAKMRKVLDFTNSKKDATLLVDALYKHAKYVMEEMTTEDLTMSGFLSKRSEFTPDTLEYQMATLTLPEHPYTVPHLAISQVFLTKFIPDLHYEDRNSDVFRFKFSHAGHFQCTYTNLVFKIKDKAEVLYSVVSWDNNHLGCVVPMHPAGPLYNITCQEGSICNLHLPHCVVHSDRNLTDLAVAHFHDENIELIKPLEVTDTHVIIDINNLSDFGLIQKNLSKKINCQVLLFLREIHGKIRRNLLHIHLLPSNVPVQKVKRHHQKKKYIETSSDCRLIRGKKYKPHCEPYNHQPKTAKFNWNYGPNYYPTFEVVLNPEVEELTLGLFHKHYEVWESRQIFLTDRDQKNNPRTTDDQELLRKNSSDIIANVKNVDEIVDDLNFTKEMVANVRAEKTDAAKMRKVLEYTTSKKAATLLVDALYEHAEDVMEELPTG